jgi:hypothetical protein
MAEILRCIRLALRAAADSRSSGGELESRLASEATGPRTFGSSDALVADRFGSPYSFPTNRGNDGLRKSATLETTMRRSSYRLKISANCSRNDAYVDNEIKL